MLFPLAYGNIWNCLRSNSELWEAKDHLILQAWLNEETPQRMVIQDPWESPVWTGDLLASFCLFFLTFYGEVFFCSFLGEFWPCFKMRGDLTFPTRDQPVSPGKEAWRLNHWTTREVSPWWVLNIYKIRTVWWTSILSSSSPQNPLPWSSLCIFTSIYLFF